jgi:ADP-heptose:LPS heptosyltransferase
VLVLRPGALGDTLLAVPALRALRCLAPVRLAAHAAAARLLAACGEVDAGLAFDDPSLGWLFGGPPVEEAVVAWMAEAPGGLPRGSVLAPSRPPGMDRHCARYLLETLAPLGIDLTWDDRPLDVAAAHTDEVLVHPGSGSPAKNWPAEHFAAVVRDVERPVRLVVGEADRASAARLEEHLGYRLRRLEGLPLEVLAAHLAGCHAFVGNDSGVSHLAGLCGARTIALFGPTDPHVWHPIGPDVQVLSLEADPREVAALLDDPELRPGSRQIR